MPKSKTIYQFIPRLSNGHVLNFVSIMFMFFALDTNNIKFIEYKNVQFGISNPLYIYTYIA